MAVLISSKSIKICATDDIIELNLTADGNWYEATPDAKFLFV